MHVCEPTHGACSLVNSDGSFPFIDLKKQLLTCRQNGRFSFSLLNDIRKIYTIAGEHTNKSNKSGLSSRRLRKYFCEASQSVRFRCFFFISANLSNDCSHLFPSACKSRQMKLLSHLIAMKKKKNNCTPKYRLAEQ